MVDERLALIRRYMPPRRDPGPESTEPASASGETPDA
jgi:hypothetical protein